MTFAQKLEQAWKDNNSLVCVGLDPDRARIPEHLSRDADVIFSFNREIIDATADLVCAYKPQFAFYAGQNALGSLRKTLTYIRDRYPNIPVILDAKRGDIGSTAMMYAREAFDHYKADAVTVNPYMGTDTLKPFLDDPEKGVIVLCRTSNPGSGDFQDLVVKDSGRKLFEVVAEKAAKDWNYNGNVALVAGATYPAELATIREIVGDMPLLVPGIGAQGGDVEAVLAHGLDSRGAGLIINSSRGILYAGRGSDFAQASREATRALRDDINRHRPTPKA
ncbi:MAG TPA: orotidine-5'-phosphate decarboxylase [Opitutales bacterium]|nr:orotidine-5'-phosphate decarboxylase [Opitutales bacterium]